MDNYLFLFCLILKISLLFFPPVNNMFSYKKIIRYDFSEHLYQSDTAHMLILRSLLIIQTLSECM